MFLVPSYICQPVGWQCFVYRVVLVNLVSSVELWSFRIIVTLTRTYSPLYPPHPLPHVIPSSIVYITLIWGQTHDFIAVHANPCELVSHYKKLRRVFQFSFKRLITCRLWYEFSTSNSTLAPIFFTNTLAVLASSLWTICALVVFLQTRFIDI